MTLQRLTPGYLVLLTVLLLAFVSGCMSKSDIDAEEELDEQLYIDAKLGFSILHPLNWDQVKLPVSSPEYRQDSLNWEIPDEDISGSMQLRVYRVVEAASELTEILEEFLEEQPEHSSEEIVPYQHAIGNAIVTTSYYQDHAQRLFVIAGEKNTYVLSFFASSEGFVEHLPLFEQIANSLRER